MSVTAAAGFRAAGVHCGVKPDGVLDLAVVVADHPSSAAAVFTSSTTAAPSVPHGRAAIADGTLQAFVVVSGCANAGTGSAGMAAQEFVAAASARRLGVPVDDILVSSTGPIGQVLPVDLVVAGVDGAEPLADHGSAFAAAKAIHTTDTIVKQAVVERDGWRIGGMAKGAGMVRPDMATMLAYLTTDAVVSARTLQSALSSVVDVTFNCLNIDGCQSTNDTVAIMASGASRVEPDADTFAEALGEVCRDLVQQMAADAEGASRVVTMHISGAADDHSARELGKHIADSALVRASFYGGDPNWGRLLAAAGVAGIDVDPSAVEIAYEGTSVASGGVAVAHDEDLVADRLAKGDFMVRMALGDGPGEATIVTTDLTPDYVVFNGERS